MSTAHSVVGTTVGKIASEAITKYRAVKLNSSDNDSVDAVDTLGEVAYGVATETASATDATNNRVIAVQTEGIVVIEAGAALSAGANVRADASGKAVALAATTANQERVGVLEEASAADGDWVACRLTLDQFTTT